MRLTDPLLAFRIPCADRAEQRAALEERGAQCTKSERKARGEGVEALEICAVRRVAVGKGGKPQSLQLSLGGVSEFGGEGGCR